MPLKLLLDSNRIFHKTFHGSNPGYDALQVDAFLDIVIKDYNSFNDYVIAQQEETDKASKKIDALNEKISKLETENASLKNKLSSINANDDVSLSNIDFIKKINNLEKALKQFGVNPKDYE